MLKIKLTDLPFRQYNGLGGFFTSHAELDLQTEAAQLTAVIVVSVW